jgi:phospholipase/carboxylesterase
VSGTLSTVEVNPKGEALGTVLWLHGLGADGHDFEGLVPLLGLPRVRFVFPHAPTRPVTVNGGFVMRAWYDIRGAEDPQKNEDAPGIHDSAREIAALIEREGERGVPPSRLVLAGFSQGGALALYVGARYPQMLLGIMVLSAYEVLPGEREKAHSANARTPILFCHGTFDPVVPFVAGREASRAYSTAGRPVEWYEFPITHQVSPEEIDVIKKWLQDRFSRVPTS